ncbi:hypothetical protein BRD20_03980 [Halobacteriales archaeon SW_8_65_20]|nr:MAG: hypothetical protein BRC71_00795 [Halobacteriales archaeon QH_7_65_31]PSQ53342.1 MAG: hypothetical protein BRD20_03980 [Halobacteriales archaeon SW_8_65_20]
MARSILSTVGLAATVALAVPLVIFGIEQLLAGERLVGSIVLAVAAAMVLVEEYLTTPTDIPGLVAEKTVGAVVEEPDED